MFESGDVVEIPFLLTRDIVIFPHMVVPLYVGRDKSVAAIEHALKSDSIIFCLTQIDPVKEHPKSTDLYKIGTICKIAQLIKLPDSTYKILVEGVCRATRESISQQGAYIRGKCTAHTENMEEEEESQHLVKTLYKRFDKFAAYSESISSDILVSLRNVQEPGRLCDLITLNLSINTDLKQTILETLPVPERVERVVGLLHQEVEWMKIDQRIHNRVKQRISKEQERYYKHQKLKAIQEELGDNDLESGLAEADAFMLKIEELKLAKEVKEKAVSEAQKLKMMAPMSAEATVVRTYLEWLMDIPWHKENKIEKDMKKSKAMLDKDHYGLEKIKERILENLAVQQRVKKLKGPVLCLVGPPGVGKTSLGKSIAQSVGRAFVRISLGGVRDESEIRGHRKTYIGAMPGRIIKAMKRAKVINPLIMLDEVDKMGMDSRGDPASALLEVLDPEQNKFFSDHYLEVDYDLSNVLFIATANSMEIPEPLLDRMEIIRIPGYTENEKLHIATEHLLPKVKKRNGIKKNELQIGRSAFTEIIRSYTRESGVRGLEKELDKIARKVVRNNTERKKQTMSKVAKNGLRKYLGVARYEYGMANKTNQIGLIRGLAWTSVGGELLTIEALVYPGKGDIVYTGSLGDVMKESIKAAFSIVKSQASQYNIGSEDFKKIDIHVHVPEGATPKDGPSAGIGMCAVMLSAIANIPIKASIALTGEVTLAGKVLAIGGLKEKLLAALRGEIVDVIIPYDNKKDIEELPEEVKKGLNIHLVKNIKEVFPLVFELEGLHTMPHTHTGQMRDASQPRIS